MRGGGGVGVAQGRRARGGAGGGCPSFQHLPLDRVRVLDGGNCSGGDPRYKCRSPHLLYIWHYATGAHQPSIGLGIPDQDANQGPSSPLGQLVEINTNKVLGLFVFVTLLTLKKNLTCMQYLMKPICKTFS